MRVNTTMTFQKILCIGAVNRLTDEFVTRLAKQHQTTNWGLVDSPDYVPTESGYYHTTVVDLEPGDIALHLAEQFDKIILLEQPRNFYSHHKILLTSFRLMVDLEKDGHTTDFRSNKNVSHLVYWHNLLRKNLAICSYPWTLLLEDFGYTTVCPKSPTRVTDFNSITNWQTDKHYIEIRNKMLVGEKQPEHCQLCYDREAEGEESTRMYETLEWVSCLELETEEDLKKIKNPVFYEVRPSNKCNLMCRMCDDVRSHLIEKEARKIGFEIRVDRGSFGPTAYKNINLDSAKRIYFAGGEPTIMPEFFNFLEHCVAQQKTNFELCIGTNGMKFSSKLLKLLQHFDNVICSVSLDGYNKVNDYIRWGADFNKIEKNCQILMDEGHRVAFQTTFSIYNVTRIHELYEFYSDKFPRCGLLAQIATTPGDIMYAFNHPFPELVIDSMLKTQKTQYYYKNGRSVRSIIDGLLDYYSSNPRLDVEKLKKFYEYNDKLDQSRNSKLIDYIPELDAGRKFI